MYKNEKLKKRITECGELYSPRVYKQRIPWMVLKRECKQYKIVNNRAAVKACLHAYRDIHDLQCKHPTEAARLGELWEPAFKSLARIAMEMLGRPEEEKMSFKDAQIGLWVDPIRDSFYENNSIRWFCNFISAVAIKAKKPAYSSQDKIEKFMNAYYVRNVQNYGAIPVQLTAHLADTISKEMQVIWDTYVLTGYYHTYKFFAVAGKYYHLSDELIAECKKLLNSTREELLASRDTILKIASALGMTQDSVSTTSFFS